MTRANDERRKSKEKHKGRGAKREKQGGGGEVESRIIRPELNWPRGECSWNREITILRLAPSFKEPSFRAIWHRTTASESHRYRLTFGVFSIIAVTASDIRLFQPRLPGIIKFLPFQPNLPSRTIDIFNHERSRTSRAIDTRVWKNESRVMEKGWWGLMAGGEILTRVFWRNFFLFLPFWQWSLLITNCEYVRSCDNRERYKRRLQDYTRNAVIEIDENT